MWITRPPAKLGVAPKRAYCSNSETTSVVHFDAALLPPWQTQKIPIS
jgi:hypothetical protein